MNDNANDGLTKRVTAIVAKYAKTSEIREDSRLQRDLGLDSFDLVNIAMEAQESSGLAFTDKTLPILTTMGDLLEYARGLTARLAGDGKGGRGDA